MFDINNDGVIDAS